MSLSSDDDSSDSSGNEYLVTPGKLDLDSTFFQQSSSTSNTATSFVNDDDSSENSDDDFVDGDDKVDSTALLAEVMKNLENANKPMNTYDDREATNSSASPALDKSSPKKEINNVLSDEITNLLLQGESGVSTSSFRVCEEDKDAPEEKKSTEYTVPKEGVNITLPGTAMMMFGRRKKNCTKLEDVLRKRMNQRIRKNQIYVHKVGLLCWLAHGFHLNAAINNTQVLSVALSLVPSSSYPKGRVDLRYLEQFTKWFRNLFKIEFRDAGSTVRVETLLTRLSEKKIQDHRELVLLYGAMLRAIGLNCRLVVSLCAPALKPRSDQLFQNSSETKEDEKKNEKNSSKRPEKVAKGQDKKKGAKRNKTEIQPDSSDTPPEIVAENSGEVEKTTKLNARKRAADVLAKFANNRRNKTIKNLANRREEEKKLNRSPEKRKEDSQSPPKVRELRSRVIKQISESTEDEKEKSQKINVERVKDEISPGKRTRTANKAKDEIPSASTMTDSDTDDAFETKLPVKKKKNDSKRVEKSADDGGNSTKVSSSESGKTKKKIISKSTKTNIETIDDDSDDAFEPKPPAKKTRVDSTKTKGKGKSGERDSIDRRVLSSDDEPAELVDAKGAQNIWIEVYVESEESWISVSVVDDKIHCVSEIYKKAPKPVLYVVAWNSEGSLKDVTRRYCPHWLTVTRKQRVDESWWVETLSPWDEKSSVRSRAEDEMLLQRELEQPLPKTVGECKGHPLYALARHLLKFEAIYPPESVPLGHLRTGEAIYSRYCVHTLCSRETWIKKARVVKPAQDAYKIVKSMPKYDKLSGCKLPDQPLELFGKWQTTQYVPPVAKDGIVPRNGYGNVDLFKQCMLPIGTVHINLPALNRVARKLNIDCVPAVVGFNFGARGALPALEGYVVCEEFEDTLRAAWQEDQIESSKRALEKREKRIYGNWKKLIKGLFIRERLAARYDFNNDDDNDDDTEPSVSTKRSNKKVVQSKKVNGKKSKTS